ncbi:MAG: DUF4870 domain-containing protein [Phycisphaerales bacterium JB058]
MGIYVGAAVIGDETKNKGEAQSGAQAAGPEGYTVDPMSGRAKATGLTEGHRVYASWCHFGPTIAATTAIFTSGVTFIVPPLVALALWQIKNSDSQFIDDHGKEALNFQISLILLALICIPLIFACGIGIPLLVVGIPALAIIGGIMGGIRASKGEFFRYPMCIRVI